MKNCLLIIILILSIKSFSQTSSTTKIGLYKWKEVVFIQPSEINGDDLTTTVKGEGDIGLVKTKDPAIHSLAGQTFRVLKVDEKTAIIMILDYTKKPKFKKGDKLYTAKTDFYKYNFKGSKTDYTSLSDEDANSRSYGSRQRYFKVEIKDIDDFAIKESRIGGALAAGVINFPFKYRPQKGNADFSGAFNFGAGIGYKFPHKSWRQFTYSVISGYSISNVVLDSSNAFKNQGKLASTNNFTAFSFSLGLLAEYQRVQAGVFIGWDRIGKLNQREFEWQYQGKPWISVGFGFAIFSGQQERADKSPSSTQ